jgi:hypothetical protein
MRIRFAGLVVSPLIFFLFSSLAFAQVIYGPATGGRRSPEDLKAAAAAPKPSYDPHDLSGVWYGNGARRQLGTPPPMTPLGQERFDANKPSGSDAPEARRVPPALGNDPLGQCDPLGYPRNIEANGRPFEIVQTPGKIIQIFEWGHAFREIWTDGRKLPPVTELDPRWYGWAVGHWEGDTLVVESSGYDDKTWLNGAGYPHSEEMKLTERYRHPDAMSLEITMTLEDPKTYTKPWAGTTQSYKLQLPKGLTILEEVFCVPSEEQSFNQQIRDSAAGITKSK